MSKRALQVIRENIKKHERGEDATVLDLGNCNLNEFPSEALECVWVEELILSSEWEEYNLQEIYWEQKASKNQGRANQITTLPPTLFQLYQLRKLVISGSGAKKWALTNLSPLAGLANLQILSCNSTQVSDLSPLAGLMNLKILWCSSTQVADLSPLAGLTNLQLLFCSFTQVADLSPLAGLTKLQVLNCGGIQITNLLPLDKLVNLWYLQCWRTQVTDLSPLAALINLKLLSCHNTEVADLSPLAELSNLQLLYCSNTYVSDLTPLASLINLRIFYCESTQVVNLSPLAKLINLQTLICSNTQVVDLRPLASLVNLQLLSCHSTQIVDLFPILFLVEKGIEIKWQDYFEHNAANTTEKRERNAILIKDCPLTNPPIEIAKQGSAAILRYFEDLHTQGEEIVYEAKMLILGDAGAGKTSLARKIENPDAEMPEETKDSTPGIAVRSLVLNNRQPDFTMHLWDFGGQEVYHATHQFFLSKRSLYILLADGRKEEQLDYWLQMQEIYGQDSHLLLVVNQKGDMQPNLPMSDIRRDYPNVQDAQPTIINLKTDRAGAVRFRERIETTIRNLPQFEQGLRTPKKWAVIRRTLETIKEDHISLLEYRDICEKEGVTDPTRKRDLLDFLHHLGAVLYFPDIAGLNKMVILRPEWATDAVYRLLDHTKGKGDNGHFTRNDLNEVWQCAEYADYFEELLGLMEKFELCYPAPENKHVFIFPSLLLDDRPKEKAWSAETSDMQLWYEYSFMPKGIVTRLIVRQHQLLESPPIVWKRGAVFAIENARAEVVESFREKRISIRASGKQAKSLLTTLAREIDALNSGFHFNERMTLKQVVPCNCRICKTAAKAHPFDYKVLANRLERGRMIIDCEVSLDEISIPDLLRETFSDAEKILRTFERRGEERYFSGQIPMGKIQPSGGFDQLDFGKKPKPTPLKIFISYSKHDLAYKDTLLKHLSALRRDKIVTWHDRDILAGEDWDKSIKTALMEADVVVYLVTHNSLATGYIQQIELPLIEQRCEDKECRLIPVIVDYCDWTDLGFAKYNALPEKGIPITDKKWTNENQAWLKVVEGVKALLKEIA